MIRQQVNEQIEGASLEGHRVYIIEVGNVVGASLDAEQRAGEWAPLFIWSQATGEIVMTLLM